MVIYKELINGKIFTSNVDGVIDVFTKEELETKKPKIAWWSRAKKLFQSL